MTEPMVLIEKKGARADIVLNRPQRKNALFGPMMAELRDAFLAVAADASVNAVLLRGAGGAFCSGLDLKEMNADPKPAWLATQGQTWREANIAFARLDKPVVGALERYAINGGGPLAFGCDHLIVGESAYIQVGEVQRGMAAPINLAWLQAKYGEAVTLHFAMLGDPVPAPDLLRLGIATKVVPDADVLEVAGALADRLASFPPATAQKIKRAIRALGFADPEAVFVKAQSLS